MYESSIILLADTVSPQVPDTMDIEKKPRNPRVLEHCPGVLEHCPPWCRAQGVDTDATHSKARVRKRTRDISVCV